MDILIGILLLLSYVAFIVYAAKGGNLIIGFFVLTVLWCVLGALSGIVTWETVNVEVFQAGPISFGATAIITIFGSWFGRILLETGIAKSIIRKAVELGGERPAITGCLLCIVVAVIFTSAYGVGSVLAIGVIVFPITLSLGIPKNLATSTYLLSVGAGLMLNSSFFSQVSGLIPGFEVTTNYNVFAAITFGLQIIGACLLMVLLLKKQKTPVKAWAAAEAGSSDEGKNVNFLAMLTPLIPVTLAIFFKFQAITAFIIAVLWALTFTGNLKSFKNLSRLLQKTFHDGVADVGLVLGLLLFLFMYLKAAGVCAALLAPIIGPILPGIDKVFFLFLFFGLFAILAIFRGPFMLWGAGSATLALLAATGVYSPAMLLPLFIVPSAIVGCSTCPTQSWNAWAISYTKVELKGYMKQALSVALPLALIMEILAYFFFVA